MQAYSLTAAGRAPAADVLVVFKRDVASGEFGSGDERLRYEVVDVPAEPSRLPGERLEAALGDLRAAFLEPRLAAGELAADLLDVFARLGGSAAVYGDLDDAEVQTKPIIGVEAPHLRDQAKVDAKLGIERLVQIELPQCARGKPSFRKPCAGRVAGLESVFEGSGPLFGPQERDRGDELHEFEK